MEPWLDPNFEHQCSTEPRMDVDVVYPNQHNRIKETINFSEAGIELTVDQEKYRLLNSQNIQGHEEFAMVAVRNNFSGDGGCLTMDDRERIIVYKDLLCGCFIEFRLRT